ncbi:ABC transporter substrate-binding protein [Corynebacterium hindlerae]|uniref:ABC transporter substrate-binding protein n=1 Tax=Corynebacterium hindlerae TaxID=699041 RepID=UPI0031B71EDA
MKRPLLLIPALALTLTSCGDPGQSEASGEFPERLVLADRAAAKKYHPASGFGQTGVSPVYDGLLRPKAGSPDTIPEFEPALAAEMPTHNADATEWTVKLKTGIKFSDGSDFDSADVKASYDVARNLKAGSEVVARYNMIDEVQTPDEHTVVFRLKYPLAEMHSRLAYAITPSEKTNDSVPVADSELNTHPVGTGPYVFVSHKADETVLKANENYWGGTPPVRELVITTAADDTARAQRVVAGEVDGAAIPPAQAASVKNAKNLNIDVAHTADWRGISFPKVPELADPKVRQALNYGVDRQALIDGTLSGYGVSIDTLLSKLYGDAHNPQVGFKYDTAKAEQLLDEAGWVKGADGMRQKDGKPFHIDLFYAGNDTTRRDIAVEFASQMKKLGLDFELKSGTWDEIAPQLSKAAAVLGGGSAPYDPTVMVYEYLHTRTEATSKYANPGDYGSAELDALLDEARSEVDTDKRNELWKKAQELYFDNPSALVLLNLDHIYVSKPNGYQKPGVIIEPHIHDATWGPWWRMSEWSK